MVTFLKTKCCDLSITWNIDFNRQFLELETTDYPGRVSVKIELHEYLPVFGMRYLFVHLGIFDCLVSYETPIHIPATVHYLLLA